MKARTAASVVLAAGILFATSGCGFVATQATTIEYNAGDGVSGNVGDIDVRNAILLTRDGTPANLLVSFVNEGDTSHTVNVQYDTGVRKVTETVTVGAHELVTIGTPDPPAEAVVLKSIDTRPGALFPVFFQYGNETGVQLLVPVLDGTLERYSTLLPTPLQTP